MSGRTSLYVVCSPRSRVGVTTTARLLAEYGTRLRRPFATFDTNPGTADLAACFPEETTIAELATADQAWLFDCLTARDGKTKILDLSAHAWDVFFGMCRDGDFFRTARDLAVEPVVVLVVDDAPACQEACAWLRAQWPTLNLVLACDEGAAGVHRVDELLASFPVGRNFEIPALAAEAADAMRRCRGSLVRELDRDTSSRLEARRELTQWLARIFAQFRSFELRAALSSSAFLR